MEIKNIKDMSAADFIKNLRKEIANECRESVEKSVFQLMNGFKKSKLSVNNAKTWIDWAIEDIMKIIRGDK